MRLRPFHRPDVVPPRLVPFLVVSFLFRFDCRYIFGRFRLRTCIVKTRLAKAIMQENMLIGQLFLEGLVSDR